MKVNTLLQQALKCSTEDDAAKLLDSMQRAFDKVRSLEHLGTFNAEAYLEEKRAPYVRFERNRKLSDHYVTMIRPEIRGGKFVVVVETNHMLDGLGMSSQSWEVVEGLEDLIEPEESDTIAAVAQLAKKAALAQHAELIKRVGVSPAAAVQAARKSW